MMGMTYPETVHYGMWDGSSIVICAYALTLILITIKRKEYPHVFMLFVPASVIFLAIMYCPGIYSHLPFTDDNDHRQVFRRVRWMFMLLPVLSFGMTYIWMKTKYRQKAMMAGICAMLLAVSVFYTSNGWEEYGFWDRGDTQNHLYKVPAAVIAMGDIIKRNSGEFLAEDKKNTVSLIVNDDRKGEWEDSFYYLARQLRLYISPIQIRDVIIQKQNYTKPDFELGQYLDENYDYVLCPNDESLVSKYEDDGYKREWQDDKYCFMSHD